MIADLLRVALLEPVVASFVGSALAGRPDLGHVLLEICDRESDCQALGVHRIDARRSRAAWRDAAVHMRTLDPERCSHHALEAGPWSTSGGWGAMRAYTLPHLPGCWPAWVLDVPLVGAFAAARRMAHSRCRQVWGCARWAGWAPLPITRRAAAGDRPPGRSSGHATPAGSPARRPST